MAISLVPLYATAKVMLLFISQLAQRRLKRRQ